MSKVEEYVNRAYAQVEGSREEVEDLKLEMKTHLYESIADLMGEGKTEEEATSIALQRFASEEELRIVLQDVFQAQKFFSKWVGYAAWVILAVSLVGMLAGQIFAPSRPNVSQLQEEIVRIVDQQSENLPQLQQELKALVAESPAIKEMQVDSFDSDGGEISINAEQYEILSGVENLETLFHYKADSFYLPITLVGSTYGTASMAIYIGVIHYGILGNLIVFFGIGASAVLFLIRRIIVKHQQKYTSL